MALYAFGGTWNKDDTGSDELDENTNVYNFLRFYAPGDPEGSTPLMCTISIWRTMTRPSSPLFFFANDARLSAFGRDFYDNNEGAINVTVDRVA